MANKANGNAFMASAQKSKREMADIQKGTVNAKSAEKEFQKISILIPAELHRKAQIHRIETGENMTRLIVRLLTEELC